MDDQITLIGMNTVAWQEYLSLTSEWFGHSPSKGVDACPSKLTDFAKYTASLGEFLVGKELDAKRTLRERGPWLQHTFFTFMFIASDAIVLKVAETTDLSVLSAKAEEGRGVVVSGTLEQWRDAVVLCCGVHSNKRLRSIFNQIKQIFDQMGLQDVFFEFRPKDAGDGTFLLEYKP